MTNNNDQGVTRVAELENVLEELIDLVDSGDLMFIDSDVNDVVEHARVVLDRDAELDSE